MDQVFLQTCRPYRCLSHILSCRGEALFPSLPPGEYLLTLRRGSREMRLLLRLPPKTCLELVCSIRKGRCCWRRSPFPLC